LDRLIADFRRRDKTVGVVAVDPSSPYSGGAILGDRVRMRRHSTDKGVFVRSMATRGQLGGLSKTTREVALVLDAMGYDIILIETVGTGQDEVDVMDLAHTTAVVSLPGMGDGIQAMKAGILEIADLFIVNKADKPGADDVVMQLNAMLDMRTTPDGGWRPPVIKTVALKNEGIAALTSAFLAHHQYLVDSGKLAEHMARREFQFFRQLVKEMAAQKIFEQITDTPAYETLLENLRKRNLDPYSAAEQLVAGLKYRPCKY
jgi:LAO/AO transport system kinase